MRVVKQFFDWLALRSVEPGLAQAQYGELQRQIPLLYALLGVNAVAVAFTHHGTAPLWLTLWIPSLLVTISAVRLFVWLKSSSAPVSEAQALHEDLSPPEAPKEDRPPANPAYEGKGRPTKQDRRNLDLNRRRTLE